MKYFEWNRRSAALAMDDHDAPISLPSSALLTPDTAAFVRKYAASLQQLVNAEGVAVGYGSPSSMTCVASSGFSAPQLGSELSTVAAAREAIQHNRAVVYPWNEAEASICAIQSCIAIPAPRESETSTLLIVYGPSGDTLGGSGMRMLEAAAEYLAFIITAAVPAPAPELELLEVAHDSAAFECLPNTRDLSIPAGPRATERQLPYFDAPPDLEAPAVSTQETLTAKEETSGAAPAWEQFDLLDEPDGSNSQDCAIISANPSAAAEHQLPVQSAVEGGLLFAHLDKARPHRPLRALAACALLVLLAGSLLLVNRKTSLAGAPLASSGQGSQPQAAPRTSAPSAARPTVVLPDKSAAHSKATSRTEDLIALRAKALSGDAVVRRRLADALAKSSDPALQREAYAWYIVLGEMGDANAHRRARELNNKIPKNKIGEVRERVAAVFEQSVSSTQDLPKAYEWYLLAANSGANVQPQLEHLRRQMTPDEVRLAESTAHEWLQRQRVMSER